MQEDGDRRLLLRSELNMLSHIMDTEAAVYFSWNMGQFYLVLPDGTHEWYPNQDALNALVDKAYLEPVDDGAGNNSGLDSYRVTALAEHYK